MNKDWQKEFKERYLDKNTPSGLNQRDFKNFTEVVRDIPSFIQQLLDNREAEVREARDQEIATLITNTVMNHVTPELEEKLPIRMLKDILAQLSNNGETDV